MEGPSIVILKEEIRAFKGKKILKAIGNTKIDKERLVGQKIISFQSWGKHFLIEFKNFSLRIHFLMFGSYRINSHKNSTPRLQLKFEKGELNFYTCSIQFIEEKLDDVYDWEADVMNDQWNERKALKKLKMIPNTMICDALLDQQIFAGSGNIIKNEVLYRVQVHPESFIAKIPLAKLKEAIKAVRDYSFDFYTWKKKFELRKHWLIYTKKKCPLDHKVIKKYTGEGKRRSFFCPACQLQFI